MSNRQRLINAVVFFAKNTNYCGKIKLFKLLYLLDFEHFRQTGKSVTGFSYQAWKFGPVPIDLMAEWEQMEPDLASVVHIVEEQVIDFVRQTVTGWYSMMMSFRPASFASWKAWPISSEKPALRA